MMVIANNGFLKRGYHVERDPVRYGETLSDQEEDLSGLSGSLTRLTIRCFTVLNDG